MNTVSNKKAPENKLPAYIDFIYGDLYQNPKKCAARDNRFSCGWRSFFQYQKLVSALSSEIKYNDTILQFGLTFGNQIDEVAMASGNRSKYHIIDINAAEVARAAEKYGNIFSGLKLSVQDGANFKTEEKYDDVICFMLLSMVPSATKAKIVNCALECAKNKGKVIFIDWHNPFKFHPLRYVVRMYNRLKHPFVERLWDRQISAYAEPLLRADFNWRTTSYFGGMFQKTVAVRKKTKEEILEQEEISPYNFEHL